MKNSSRLIYLLAVTFQFMLLNAHAATTSVLNLVKPIVPPDAVGTVSSGNAEQICENGLVLQSKGKCCPAGTNNNLWSDVCTPDGTIDGQIFNRFEVTQYCPDSDMFIVSDKKGDWFSCANSNSAAFYTTATKFEGSKFCMSHGYGFLIKINPWGTVGCIKYGDSQGDGCIEAGTCFFNSVTP